MTRAATLVAALGLVSPAGCASTTPAAGGSGSPGPGSASASAPGPRAPSPATTPGPPGDAGAEWLRIAARARHYEEHGEYAAALGEWVKLGPKLPADADLELATAIDEARSGRLESAATRLSGALLSAAALDTLPTTRYRAYAAAREGLYLNGTFDGWHWYVWRARAEVAAARGRWEEATIAARRCVAARPLSGKDWLLLAVCAGRAGWADEARAAVRQSVTLDGGVPEAHHLGAIWAWKDGRRGEAQAGFRAALAADAAFNPSAVALVRSRLPGAAPDSLPTEFLTGPRAVGMLTSTASPKLEDHVQPKRGPRLTNLIPTQVPDSLRRRMLSPNIKLWLFVDPEGRVVLHELAWYPPGMFPTPVVSEFAAVLPLWRFEPRTTEGDPRGIWLEISHGFPH